MCQDNLKSREEYLIAYSDKLLYLLDSTFNSANKLMVICYTIALLLGIAHWKTDGEITYFGMNLSKNAVFILSPISKRFKRWTKKRIIIS